MIPVNEPLLDGNEKTYLNECINTGWISSEGPFIKAFESGLSARVDRRYGVAVLQRHSSFGCSNRNVKYWSG